MQVGTSQMCHVNICHWISPIHVLCFSLKKSNINKKTIFVFLKKRIWFEMCYDSDGRKPDFLGIQSTC